MGGRKIRQPRKFRGLNSSNPPLQGRLRSCGGSPERTIRPMTDSSGYQKMVSGQPYPAPDWDLIEMQAVARRKLDQLNAVPSFDMANRRAMLRDQLGGFGESLLLSPVHWEYGKHIHI